MLPTTMPAIAPVLSCTRRGPVSVPVKRVARCAGLSIQSFKIYAAV